MQPSVWYTVQLQMVENQIGNISLAFRDYQYLKAQTNTNGTTNWRCHKKNKGLPGARHHPWSQSAQDWTPSAQPPSIRCEAKGQTTDNPVADIKNEPAETLQNSFVKKYCNFKLHLFTDVVLDFMFFDDSHLFVSISSLKIKMAAIESASPYSLSIQKKSTLQKKNNAVKPKCIFEVPD
uniref:(northern house mosquito) hypothetical protein n=1 Tax=Culex pipiens TaxID=7175 RepID=A0A8D8BF89_CULPI